MTSSSCSTGVTRPSMSPAGPCSTLRRRAIAGTVPSLPASSSRAATTSFSRVRAMAAHQNLPTPDATGAINMSATSGKVALVNNSTILTGSCPSGTGIVDFVGYGGSANCSEGIRLPLTSPTLLPHSEYQADAPTRTTIPLTS